jgi:hypothetical protein
MFDFQYQLELHVVSEVSVRPTTIAVPERGGIGIDAVPLYNLDRLHTAYNNMS